MSSFVEKGMWKDLDKKAGMLQEKIDFRQRLLLEAKERDSFVKLRQVQAKTYHELRGRIASWAHKQLLNESQKKIGSGERRFLSSIQKALSRANPCEKLPFVSTWTRERMEKLLSLSLV
jgi:hypothetical protein